MGLIGYGIKGLIRNRGRTFGITIGVIIAMTLISATNIATDSMTSYEVQKSMNDVVVDLRISSNVDDPAGIMAILDDVKQNYSEIEDIIPIVRCEGYYDLVLNATGPIYWPDINASLFAQSNFEAFSVLAGFDRIELDHPRLQGIINITEGTFPYNNASILVDDATAFRFNLTTGSNLSIGILSSSFYYGIGTVTNYTQSITNLTVSGVFQVLNYEKLGTFLSAFPQLGEPVILANLTTMRGLLDFLIPDIEIMSPYTWTDYNLLINHAIVDVYDIDNSKSKLIQISNDIYKKGGLYYKFYTSDTLYNRIQSIQAYVGAINGLLILVSVPALLIGIYLSSTLYNQTLERRTAEIGQLKSKGASTRQIALWFLLESGIIGLFGGTIGFIGGFGLSPLFLMTTLQKEYPQFLSMSIIHSDVTSLIFTLVLSVGICLLTVIKPIRRLNKLVVVDATKDFINYRAAQPWKSKSDVPALVLGIIPLAWLLVFNNEMLHILPSDIRPIFTYISQAINALAIIAPFLLAYGVIKVVAGRSPPRFAKIAQGVATLVTRKSAWLIGRNVSGRPKQSGGLVFIIALTICLGIVTSTTRASQERYDNNLVYCQVGADIRIEINSKSNVNNSFALRDTLQSFSSDIDAVTAGLEASCDYRGSSGGSSFSSSGWVVGLNATEYCDVVRFKPEFLTSGDPGQTFSNLANKANGSLVLESWAKINGYMIGDPLFAFFQGDSISFEIVGFISALPGFYSPYSLTIAANYDYLNSSLVGIESFLETYSETILLVKMVDQPTVSASVLAQTITTSFPNDVDRYTTLESVLANSGSTGFASIVESLDLEYAIIVIIATAGLAIIISRSFSDRRRENATLRARGMEFRDLLKIQGGEGTTLVVLGTCLGAVGLLMGYFLNYELGVGFSTFATLPRLYVIPMSLLWQIIITFAILIAVVWLISWREVKRTEIPEIADILRVY